MHLISYLEHLTPSTLKKILEENGIKVKKASPNQLVEMVENQLLKKENIITIHQQMNEYEKEVLNYFILHNHNQIFAFRKLQQLNGRLTIDQFVIGLTLLRRKGIIYTVRKTRGELGFVMPEDLYRAWHYYFFADEITEQGKVTINVHSTQESTTRLEEELFSLLSYIGKEEITITLSGKINKRAIAKLNDQVKLDQTKLEYFPFSKKINNDYPENLQLLLELALSLELIELTNKVKPTNLITNWYQLSPNERKELLEKKIRLMFNSTEILHNHFLYCLLYLPEEHWYFAEDILKLVYTKLTRPFSIDGLERAKLEVLFPLQSFGLIELKQDHNGKLVVRKTTAKHQEWNQIYVQPNYEILVPKGFPYNLRSIVEDFAILIQQDQMNKYLLTKESVINSLDNEQSIEGIIQFLQTYSAIPIQENIIASLQDWNKQYGKVSFMDVRILKCESEDIAKELKSQPMLQDWIIKEISPTHFIIKEGNHNQLIKKMQNIGFYPKREIWTQEREQKEQYLDDNVDYDNQFYGLRQRNFYIENIFPPIPRW